MKKVDYIVVGCGLAGMAFCEQLNLHNKSYLVFDDCSQSSSLIAAGLYNAVILKRFTEAWKAKIQLEQALPFYQNLEEKLQIKVNQELPIYRCFASIEEQNNWFVAADKPNLSEFLSTKLIKNHNESINAPYGFGKVLKCGKIETGLLLKHYINQLKKERNYCNEQFVYERLIVNKGKVLYKDISAKFIVFAEGFGMVNNPFFAHLPMKAAKGEMITIKAPKLNIDFILKSSVFIIPEGNDLYSVGATYNWEDTTNAITKDGRIELVNQLESLINCEFEVVDQVAGIRPTVKDRRPLLGVHAKHNNVSIFNGLGTRGVMLAPYLAPQLFNYLENQKPLDAKVDINRFNNKDQAFLIDLS